MLISLNFVPLKLFHRPHHQPQRVHRLHYHPWRIHTHSSQLPYIGSLVTLHHHLALCLPHLQMDPQCEANHVRAEKVFHLRCLHLHTPSNEVIWQHCIRDPPWLLVTTLFTWIVSSFFSKLSNLRSYSTHVVVLRHCSHTSIFLPRVLTATWNDKIYCSGRFCFRFHHRKCTQ